MKHVFLLAMLALAPLAALQAADAPKPAKPNILVILADDLGWGSVGCYGANPDLVRTPNIDRLSKEGCRLTDANTTSSVCSPTRYPAKGESADKAISLGKQRVKFRTHGWQTLRLTFQGDELTAEVAGITLKAKDAVIAELKEQVHFIAFDGDVGLRNLLVTK